MSLKFTFIWVQFFYRLLALPFASLIRNIFLSLSVASCCASIQLVPCDAVNRNKVSKEKIKNKKGGVDVLKLCCDWRHHKEPVEYGISLNLEDLSPYYPGLARVCCICTWSRLFYRLIVFITSFLRWQSLEGLILSGKPQCHLAEFYKHLCRHLLHWRRTQRSPLKRWYQFTETTPPPPQPKNLVILCSQSRT
jgi:hypothetical protein